MKVFISWSGPRSRLLAEALRDWIPEVIQSVVCFCSTEDIRAGQRWNNEVNAQLESTDFGVLCVTPENIRAPWLNFEAGALAKRINDDARVVPVTMGFSPGLLEEPLKQFNGTEANRAGITKLMTSIADVANPTMDIGRAVDRWWDDLASRLADIPASEEQVATPEPPDISEMFGDIMSSIRGLGNEVRESRPVSSFTGAEWQIAARILAEDADLRHDVALGIKGAWQHLRTQARLAARRGSDAFFPKYSMKAELVREKLVADAEADEAMRLDDELRQEDDG